MIVNVEDGMFKHYFPADCRSMFVLNAVVQRERNVRKRNIRFVIIESHECTEIYEPIHLFYIGINSLLVIMKL